MKNILPKARISDIVLEELDNETLIYDMKTHQAYCLNETSSLVWTLCDGKKSISLLTTELNKRKSGLFSEDMIRLTLDILREKNLLADTDDFRTGLEGMNRREIIRKIGYTSMVALPLVTSIVVPTGAAAQSCLGIEARCTDDSQCCTGICNTDLPGFCCTIRGVSVNTSGGGTCLSGNGSSCDGFGTTQCCSGQAVEDTTVDCTNSGGGVWCACV